MTDGRHDGGTAGSGRDAGAEPGQDLDALLSRWTEQPGPYARGRHSAPEPPPAPAALPPAAYLPPSGRRFRDDDAPPPEWARRAGERTRRRSAPDPAPPPAPHPGPSSRDADPDGRGPSASRGAPGSWGGAGYGGSGLDGRSGAEVAAAAYTGRQRRRADAAPPDPRSGSGLRGDRPGPQDQPGPATGRDGRSGLRDRGDRPGPVSSRNDLPGPAARDGRSGAGLGRDDRPAGRDGRSGAGLGWDDLPGPAGRGGRSGLAVGRDERPGSTGRGDRSGWDEPVGFRSERPGSGFGPGGGFRTDSGPELRGFTDEHPSGPNLGFGPMAAGRDDLHRALLAPPAPARVPAFDDTGAYAGWLARGGTATAGAAVLDPPRPTATGRDLLTHDPTYDPYGPETGWPAADPDDAEPPTRRPHRRRARSRRPRWLRILGWVGAFVGILLVAGGGFAAYQYKKLSGNINREDALATDDKAIRDAAKQLDAENYLLLGSDTRAGANGRYEDNAGQVSGERSDTTILAHLSPDRAKATMISFPRDAWVRLPACRQKDGTMAPERDGQFNEAFATGGAQCTVLAVQKLTGIRINHYVQVDFTGFKSMVDAVGGVPICTTTRLRDSESGLKLDPGTTNLKGEQALAFVRARYGIGDGSDLGRIQRQQRFLAAMVRKATSTKLLLNPVGLTKFLNAATKSLTLDRQTSLGDLKKLADQLRDLDPKRVSFLTAPIANAAYTPPGFPAPPPGQGGSKVLLDDVAGRKLWDAIINDKPAPPKGAPKSSGPAKPAVLTVAPEDVTVKVLNGVGLDGLARKVAGEMESVGFRTVEPTNTAKVTRTTVRYAPSQAAAARTVAAAVPGAVLQPSNDVGTAVELVVGPDYTSVVTVQVGDPATARTVAAPKPTATTSAPKPSPTVNAADATCT